jgi:DNA-binding response OmpR family regulator
MTPGDSPKPQEPRGPAGGRPRVVVTNHDAALIELLRLLVTDEGGYEALVPPDLDDPYPFIKAMRPAAVVLDVVYREESDSLTTLDKLKLDPETTAIPILVCTTTPAMLEGVRAREAAGDLAVLAKPFELDTLLERLTALLAGRPT